jgi:hypothetical protein
MWLWWWRRRTALDRDRQRDRGQGYPTTRHRNCGCHRHSAREIGIIYQIPPEAFIWNVKKIFSCPSSYTALLVDGVLSTASYTHPSASRSKMNNISSILHESISIRRPTD